jgi:hypothetical protein
MDFRSQVVSVLDGKYMVSAAGGFELSFLQEAKTSNRTNKVNCDDRIGLVLGYLGLIKKQKVKSGPEILINGEE